MPTAPPRRASALSSPKQAIPPTSGRRDALERQARAQQPDHVPTLPPSLYDSPPSGQVLRHLFGIRCAPPAAGVPAVALPGRASSDHCHCEPPLLPPLHHQSRSLTAGTQANPRQQWAGDDSGLVVQQYGPGACGSVPGGPAGPSAPLQQHQLYPQQQQQQQQQGATRISGGVCPLPPLLPQAPRGSGSSCQQQLQQGLSRGSGSMYPPPLQQGVRSSGGRCEQHPANNSGHAQQLQPKPSGPTLFCTLELGQEGQLAVSMGYHDVVKEALKQ